MKFKAFVAVLVLLGIFAVNAAPASGQGRTVTRKHSAAWYRTHRKHSAAWYRTHRSHSAAWYRTHRKSSAPVPKHSAAWYRKHKK